VSVTSLKVGDHVIDLSVPVVMGIVNATPDSFSDGGRLAAGASAEFQISIDKALTLAERMLQEGASLIDVGGESTRPGAASLSEQEELDRVIPVIEAIRARLDTAISVDTSTPAVMAEAIAAGAGLVNDVRALRRPGALAAVAGRDVAICLMHMRGEPGTMQQDVQYEDVVAEVQAFLAERVDACVSHGIARSRLVLDPGFGFGKSVEQNYRLLRELPRMQALGLPVLVGMSRKSMLGAVTGRPVDERVHAGVAASVLALQGGASILRTHDVAPLIDAIRIQRAFAGARQ
jgi:dihydropteroate synthase